MSDPVEDMRNIVAKAMARGWKENPVLVPDKLVETARKIARDNDIHVSIKGVWRKEYE